MPRRQIQPHRAAASAILPVNPVNLLARDLHPAARARRIVGKGGRVFQDDLDLTAAGLTHLILDDPHRLSNAGRSVVVRTFRAVLHYR